MMSAYNHTRTAMLQQSATLAQYEHDETILDQAKALLGVRMASDPWPIPDCLLLHTR